MILWNHLWQSTLCAAVAWALTLLLRNNRAAVRYWIWMAASVKFLIPFSWLIAAGGRIGWRTAPALQQSGIAFVVDEISRSLAAPADGPPAAFSAPAHNLLTPVLWAGWLIGFAAGVTLWIRWWRQIRAARLAATPLDLNLPIRAMSSPTRLEPGVFGIRRPVLLLPEGIADRLTAPQLDLILAHELCHVRRRDNLTAAIHMAVETIFWFHPLVWWLRARLIEERERACDEAVLGVAGDPRVYAEGILNVCKFYLSSPLVCASGVTGSDLKKRIEAIMTNRTTRQLTRARKALLIATAFAALAGPVAIGVLTAVPGQGQSRDEPPPQTFEVASVKPHRGGILKGDRTRNIEPGKITYMNATLSQLVELAYGLKHYQVSGPDWALNPASTDRYDVIAAAASPVPAAEIKRMLAPLLAERFHLAFHRESKDLPVYALVVAKGGPKFKQPGDGGAPNVSRDGEGGFLYQNYPMSLFADWLTGLPSLGRPVIDRTGLDGPYSFHANLFNFPKEMSEVDRKIAIRDGDGGDAVFSSLQEQLGLKLEAQKAQLGILVIDRADKIPTEN
jgi:bla regulator protein BlaR1